MRPMRFNAARMAGCTCCAAIIPASTNRLLSCPRRPSRNRLAEWCCASRHFRYRGLACGGRSSLGAVAFAAAAVSNPVVRTALHRSFGLRRRIGRLSVWHAESISVRIDRDRPLGRRRHRRRHARHRTLQMADGHQLAHRGPLRAAARDRHRRRPHRLLFRRP